MVAKEIEQLQAMEDSLILFLNYHGSQVRELCEINKSNRLNGFFIPVGQIV